MFLGAIFVYVVSYVSGCLLVCVVGVDQGVKLFFLVTYVVDFIG